MNARLLKPLRLVILAVPLFLFAGSRPVQASMPVPMASTTLDAVASDRAGLETVQYWRHRRHWRRHHRYCRYHRC